ncbi:MAG: site-2 protease family protein [Candidatus Limnocylindrales bacterium]
MDSTTELIIAAVIILVVSFPVHEAAHAWMAYRLGDSTARYLGRLSLNPIVHFDPLGGLMLLASAYAGYGIGWAKPTPVNFANLRNGRTGEAMVAAAGPVSNLLIAAAGGVVFRIMYSVMLNSDQAVSPGRLALLNIVYFFVSINVSLFLFNLIPVPPLDGARVLLSALSRRQAMELEPLLNQYGVIVLLVLIFIPFLTGGAGPLGFVFQNIGQPIVRLIAGQ